MISLILAKKILSMFLMIFAGLILVKLKIVKPEESRILSILTLYLIMPCAVFSALMVDYTETVWHGLVLAIAAASVIHIWMILLAKFLARVLKLDGVEQAAVIYSNAGNLILPIVTSVLGSEWLIYTTGFIVVQNCMMWSHGKMIICGERGIDIKKIVTNINMISIFIGLIMFLLRLRFPEPVQDAVSSIGSMLGPLSMLVTGILLGNVSWKRLLSYRRLWFITLIRLVISPLGAVLIVKYSGLMTLLPNAPTILMVTLLAAMAPMASTVTQLAQVYDKNPDYASAINVATTLGCIVTMPLMIAFYQI